MHQLAVVVQLHLLFEERQRVGADDLAQEVSNRLANLGALDLEDRGLRAGHAALLRRGEDAQGAHLDGHQLHFHFRDLGAEQRVFEHWLAIADFLHRDALQMRQHRLGRADAGQARAFVGQQVLGAGPALVFLADEVLHRHADVVEEDLVDLVVAVQGDDRPHADAGAFHIDQQEADTALLLRLGVGAHQAEDHVGVLAEGGPGLLAVDHVVVAVAHGAGLQARQVGTCARLGIALAPPVLARKNARQVMVDLLLGAKLDDHRGDHVDPKGHGTRRAEGRALLIEDVLFHRAPGGAAQLHRPARRVPAALDQNLLPALVILFGHVLAELDLGGDVRRQLAFQEGAHFIAKGELFGRVIHVHGKVLMLRSVCRRAALMARPASR